MQDLYNQHSWHAAAHDSHLYRQHSNGCLIRACEVHVQAAVP